MNYLSEMSNDDMLSEMEKCRFTTGEASWKSWTLNVNVGDFCIIVYPTGKDKQLDHIKNATKVLIEMYDRGESLPPEVLAMPDMTFSNGTTISFNVKHFPHHGISPKSDFRFKDQPWAKHFDLKNLFGTTGTFTLNEMCDIIRYCVKIQNLKAFL